MRSIIRKTLCSKLGSKIIVRPVSFENNSKAMKEFREELKSAKSIVFLTGSGISEESGLPSFAGPGIVWRSFTSLALTYPPTFLESPSVFWEFYNYRRELAAKARPNEAHIAMANYELKYRWEKEITTITQNVDSMHSRAGSVNLIELNGSLFRTRCTRCGDIAINTSRPICPALMNTGSPDASQTESAIAIEDLPRCETCGALLRPGITWFGESVDSYIKERASEAISKCDICVVVSMDSLVTPAASYPRKVAARGATVAEFNNNTAPEEPPYHYYFEGPCTRTLPYALSDK